MPAHKALPIQLSSTPGLELSALVRAHSTPRKLAKRARIILLAASGRGVDERARTLSTATRGVFVRAPLTASTRGPRSLAQTLAKSAISV